MCVWTEDEAIRAVLSDRCARTVHASLFLVARHRISWRQLQCVSTLHLVLCSLHFLPAGSKPIVGRKAYSLTWSKRAMASCTWRASMRGSLRSFGKAKVLSGRFSRSLFVSFDMGCSFFVLVSKDHTFLSRFWFRGFADFTTGRSPGY